MNETGPSWREFVELSRRVEKVEEIANRAVARPTGVLVVQTFALIVSIVALVVALTR
jgi:hypothetical protein